MQTTGCRRIGKNVASEVVSFGSCVDLDEALCRVGQLVCRYFAGGAERRDNHSKYRLRDGTRDEEKNPSPPSSL